jgi:uncharacterized protein YjbJ (UPF0337 family)
MGDCINEAAGNVKATVGKVTGNEHTQRKGQAQSDTAHIGHQMKGVVDQGGSAAAGPSHPIPQGHPDGRRRFMREG